MKVILLISLFLCEIFTLFKVYISSKSEERELPDNVKDVYDEKEYNNWKKYNKEEKQLDLIDGAISAVIFICFLLFDWAAKLYYMFDINDYLRYLWVLFAISVFTTLCSLPFDYYDTFVIEEKYGLNTSTKLTFFIDTIKDIATDLVLSLVTLAIIKFIYDKFGNEGTILMIIILVGIALLLAMFVMIFLKIYNKFTPLPEGELRDKLIALCNKYNVKVKKIVIKDESKRTTTSNAFCTGLGNRKTISLDDNLVNNYTPDQIVAVFAHEFGHAKYRHMFKTIPFAIIKIIATIIMVIVMFNLTNIYYEFGFGEMNYIMAFVILGLLVWPIRVLYDLFINKISRKHEYEADAFAAKEGYGKELISALKKLSKESLSNINPHPIIVKLNYSHPTLSERISAIEKNMRK